ncbi:MAG TPA: c-type cytochrome, partial [Opitutaceae bacterium]|nr:c-type cytochrome [Opitutaceae bacterium]
VPGRIVSTWFNPTRLGTYPIYCAQYCGTAHAQMLGTVVVLDETDFTAWNHGGTHVGSSAELGAAAYSKYGCATCHEAGPARAPSLSGLYGTQVSLADGRKVRADDAYLADAILRAPENRVAGYPADMPSYTAIMSPPEALRLAAYLRTLGHGSWLAPLPR